jgi:predicted transcriptional regulator of viral defense system
VKWHDPDEARRKLFDIAQSQAGYFTSSQAVQAGYSHRLQHYHVQRGHWRRIERALFRLRDYPPAEHEDLVRWFLWSGGAAVVSHETAAAVHDLGDLMPARVHLTVPPGFRKALPPAVVVHRARLAAPDVQEHSGFTVTTPLRTILDLKAAATESDWLAGVVRDALARGMVRRSEMERALAV